jgi:hypothetical protein
LIGEYDNKTVYVWANYATATSSQSLYVQWSFTSHAAVTRFFTLTDWTYRMFTSSSPWEAWSPAIGTWGGKDLDSSNYCITAIR